MCGQGRVSKGKIVVGKAIREAMCVCFGEKGRLHMAFGFYAKKKEMSSGNIPIIIESSDLNRYLYTSGHSSIIHNGQTMEATEMPIDG